MAKRFIGVAYIDIVPHVKASMAAIWGSDFEKFAVYAPLQLRSSPLLRQLCSHWPGASLQSSACVPCSCGHPLIYWQLSTPCAGANSKKLCACVLQLKESIHILAAVDPVSWRQLLRTLHVCPAAAGVD